MKPYIDLAEVKVADGTVFSLHSHDGRFYLKNDGHDLMSTALTHSEEMLAELGCSRLAAGEPGRPPHPRVLIGGLGMGFTLKRTLEFIGRPATVEVAELVPEIIEWNRTFLVEHNGPLLDDERTRVFEGDLYDCLQRPGQEAFDAILIDIDDTPDSLIVPANRRLYTDAFLRTLRRTLAPQGCLAFWLAEPAPRFLKDLRRLGLRVEEHAARPHERAKRARHRIYVARAG